MRYFNINSLRRSGHHAFIYWLVDNYFNQQTSIPNAKISFVKNDFVYINEAEFGTANTHKFLNNQSHRINTLITSTETTKESIELIPSELEKKCNITDYKHIVVIRDFYNCFASQINVNKRLWEKEGGYPNLMYNNYKSHLNAVLNNKIYGVVYDKWVLGKDYCNQVSLDLLGKENKFNPIEGKGTISSFDNQTKQLNKLLHRYKDFEYPEWFIKKAINDSELNEMLLRMGMVVL